MLLEAGGEADATAAAGTLVVAAHGGHGWLAEFLLERGADRNAAKGRVFRSPHGASCGSRGGWSASLLAYGADRKLHGRARHRWPRLQRRDYSIRHEAIGANVLWLVVKYGDLGNLRILAD